MSQWAAIVTQPNRALQLYRDKDFPLDVRHHLAPYIESRAWMSVPHSHAADELAGLISALDNKVLELHNTGQVDLVLVSLKLSQCRTHLINLYAKNPAVLLQTLTSLLSTEEQLLREEMSGDGLVNISPVVMEDSAPNISTTLTNLDNWGQSANILTQYLVNTKEVMSKMSPKKRGTVHGKMKRLQGNLDKHLQTIRHMRRYLRSTVHTSVHALSSQNNVILQNIAGYKLSLRRAMVGCDSHLNLDQLEAQVKSHVLELETCLQQIRLAVRHFDSVKHAENLEEEPIISLRDKVVSMIEMLISKSLVMEKPLSVILKKDCKFGASLRLLVGGHFGIKMHLPEVSCCLVSQHQIRDIVSGELEASSAGCGDILNGNNVMEHFSSTNNVKLFLKKLMLKKYTRASSADKAGEEMYGLCFTSKLTLHLLGERTISLCCISPSLALVVHTRQVALAEAAVIWDNAFCSTDGEAPPDEVPWIQLAGVLSSWFKLHTGRGLSDKNVVCLGKKLVGSEDGVVSWKSFAKSLLPDRAFSFWEWLYSAYDLIDKCLNDLWKDGLVEGFISKEEVQCLLSTSEPNTFMLRFSDSMVGGVSASWLHQETPGRQGEILHLEPNTHRGLSYISLAERIIGLPDLKLLFPNRPKNQVFDKYMQKREVGTSDTAYVRQNISVSVDLPRHHSTPLLSTDSSFSLNSPSTPFLDDDIFESLSEFNDFNTSPSSMHEEEPPHPDSVYSDQTMFSVNDLSLADLDLDSLLNTAQNNINSIRQDTVETSHDFFRQDTVETPHDFFNNFS